MGAVTLWAAASGSVAPQHEKWEMLIRKTRAQRRIYRYADVLGRTLDAWTGAQTEVEGTAPSSRDGVEEVLAPGSQAGEVWRKQR